MLSILWKYNVINVNEGGCYQQEINGKGEGLIYKLNIVFFKIRNGDMDSKQCLTEIRNIFT